MQKLNVMFSVKPYWKEKVGLKEFSQVFTKNVYQLYEIISKGKLHVAFVPGRLPSDGELMKVVFKLTTHESAGVFDTYLRTKKEIMSRLGAYLNSEVEACGSVEQNERFMKQLTGEASK